MTNQTFRSTTQEFIQAVKNYRTYTGEGLRGAIEHVEEQIKLGKLNFTRYVERPRQPLGDLSANDARNIYLEWTKDHVLPAQAYGQKLTDQQARLLVEAGRRIEVAMKYLTDEFNKA